MNPTNIAPQTSHPLVFEEFFELGQEESSSPFLTPDSRSWGSNLTLKASIAAAILLMISFTLSFSTATFALSNLILISVYFLAGIPSLIEAIEDLLNFEINIDILMTLAAFSSILIGSSMEGALLLVLFSLSGSIEDAVTAKAKSSISTLHRLSPTKATIIDDTGTLLERSIKDISVGAHILIKAGQIVPLDGLVIEGTSSVNQVHLTGENLPVTKKTGDPVAAGARNLEGRLILQVTHTSADSTLSRIIQLVTQAQEARPALQRWFDQLSKGYAIVIILLSAFFALTFPWIFQIPFLGFEGSLYRAVAFLIAASPCALIIAIPIAYLSAISICARRGILLKGGITLDAITHCTAVAFDKTGTLTTGILVCSGIEAFEGQTQDRNRAIAAAYALERNANHPIAKAIIAYAEQQNIPPAILRDFRSIPGYGLEGIIEYPETERVSGIIGNPDYILPKLSQEQSIRLNLQLQKIRASGELVALLLLGDEIFIFQFHDTLRPKIQETIQDLHTKRNWKIVMLTGDHEDSARKIAAEAGIDEYRANLKPEDKLHYVSQLSSQKGLVMIGDGINDAPALARATVGICMGKVGTTAAIDASDVILLHDNIELLDWLVEKAFKTRAIVRQNLILALAAIFVASLPALAGLVPLWLAVVLHEGGTVLVGLNALRLLRK